MTGVFTEKEIKKIVEVSLMRGIEEHIKTWDDVTDLLNESLGKQYKSSKTYRNVFNNYLLKSEAHETKRDIQIERNKLSDVSREYRTDIRNQARLEALQEKIIEAIHSLPPIELTPLKPFYKGTDAVVLASDWHYGAKHKNYWGEYSTEIAKERINKYANEIIRYAKIMSVKQMLILNMGDLIEGFIHVSTRVQAEIDSIEQSIQVGELFANFIKLIRNELKIPIYVGDTLDNHSRIHPNKKHHIEAESLQRVIKEFVKLRLADTDIEFVRNHIDDNIGCYRLGERNLVWVHGHLDNPVNVVQKLTQGLGFKIDDLFIAHRHSVLVKDNLLQGGNLKGVDEYAKDKRLFGQASQAFRVYDGNNKITFEIIF